MYVVAGLQGSTVFVSVSGCCVAEIVAIDPVKNAVKVFLSDGILSTEEVSGTSGPCLCLADEYCSQGAIDDLACKINDFIA